ncbi:MAG: SdrD B-like domain-containing protein [Caldilineaceae bacterium]
MQTQTHTNAPTPYSPIRDDRQTRKPAQRGPIKRFIFRKLLILFCMALVVFAALLAQRYGANAAPASLVVNPTPNDGSIGDYVWWDWNGDGLQNETSDLGARPGMNGVTVRLLNSAGQVISSTVTDYNFNTGQPGYYHFTGLTEGASYQIEVVPPQGYGFTRPNNICPTQPCSVIDGEAGNDSDINPATGRSDPQTIATGPTIPGGECINCDNVDAGLVLLGSIGDYVWWDWNGDGIQNENANAGMNDVTVRLLDSAGQVISSTVTSYNLNNGQPGYYEFKGLPAGASYQIEVVPPQGYGFTRPNNICPTTPCSIVDGEASDDSDINPATGRSDPQALANGPYTLGGDCTDCGNVDAGLVKLGSIGDYVWWDWNGDGIQNETTLDPGVSGATVRLLNSAGQVISSTVSNGGFYFFRGLPAGNSYQIEVVPPPGYGFTRPDNICPTTPCSIVGGEASDDSDIIPTTGRSHLQALANSPYILGGDCTDCGNVDVGLVKLGSIGAYVWHDADGDGRQNEGPTAGVNGVWVRLLDTSNHILTSTVTTNDTNGNPGYYHFGGLPEGHSYRVEFTAPQGYEFTIPHQECDPATIPCTITGESGEDSDADPATGRTQVVELWRGPYYPGDTCLDCDRIAAGLVTKPNQPPLPNSGDANGDGVSDNTQPNVKSALDTTGASYVTVEATGNCQELQGAGISAEALAPVSDPTTDFPFGVLSYALRCAHPGDSATVNLYWYGIDDASHLRLRKFAPTIPGQPDTSAWFTLNPTVTVVQIGGVPVVKLSLKVTDGQVGDATGVDGLIVDPIGAGTSQPGQLVVRKFVDPITNCANIINSGLPDPNPVNNSMCATAGQANGQHFPFTDNVANSSGLISPTFTLASGEAITFTQVVSGVYNVTETIPAGWRLTGASCSNGAAPSAVTIADNATVTCVFTNTAVTLYSLGNRLWVDDGAGTAANRNNGVVDSGEAATPQGVVVELLDITGTVLLTTTTDSNGYYRFDNLAAGDYQVRIPASEFAPGGKLYGYASSTGQTTTFTAADNGHDHGDDAEINGVKSAVVTLGATNPTGDVDSGATSAGANGPQGDANDNLTADFGFVPEAQFGNFVWIESDKDGIAATGVVTPVMGIVITATSSSGEVYTTTTDSTGYYSFTVPIGAYTVTYGSVPSSYGPVVPSATPNSATADRTNLGVDQQSRPNGTVVTLVAGDHIPTIDFAFRKPQADLQVHKTVSQTRFNSGDTVSYTITLTNLGPDDAPAVQVTDHLPSGVLYQGATAQQGSYDQNTGIWNVGAVPANTSVTLTITVKAK